MPSKQSTPGCAGRFATTSPKSAGECFGSLHARKMSPSNRRILHCLKESQRAWSPSSSSPPLRVGELLRVLMARAKSDEAKALSEEIRARSKTRQVDDS